MPRGVLGADFFCPTHWSRILNQVAGGTAAPRKCTYSKACPLGFFQKSSHAGILGEWANILLSEQDRLVLSISELRNISNPGFSIGDYQVPCSLLVTDYKSLGFPTA